MGARNQHTWPKGPKPKSSWNKLQPAKYEVQNCTPRCTLGEDMLGPELFKTFHSWYEQGFNDMEIGKRSDKVGHHVSYGAVGRHRAKHLFRVHEPILDDPLATPEFEKVDHVATLEQIIAMGAAKLDPRKVSPETLLKAMEMHNRLTQGRQLDETFAAITAAMSGAGFVLPTEDADSDEDNPEATRSPAELAQEMAASI